MTDSIRTSLALPADLAPVLNTAELDGPTIAALTRFARAVERASLARGAMAVAQRPAVDVRPEPSPAPIHVTIPGGPAPVPPWLTTDQATGRGPGRRRFERAELLALASAVLLCSGPVGGLATHSVIGCLLGLSLPGAVGLVTSAAVAIRDESER